MENRSPIKNIEDLIRLYNLDNITKISKNTKITQEQLESTKKSLRNILNSFALSLDIASDITLYFKNGLPLQIGNVGDIYYDVASGNTYIYNNEWVQTFDTNIIAAMALTHNFNEKDETKKVNTTQPVTPYECGDWYIKDKILYICQTTRSSGNYNSEDFIISSDYTDGTNSINSNNILTVLSGVVTKIKYGVDSVSSEITQTKTVLEQDINNQADAIFANSKDINTIKGNLSSIVSSILTQTSEQFQMLFSATNIKQDLQSVNDLVNNQNSTLDEIKSYIDFGQETNIQSPFYGTPYIKLGASTSQTKLVIRNNRISFMTGDNESAYISNNMLYINESTIMTKQTIGKETVGYWDTVIDDFGNRNTKWRSGS